MGTRIKTANSGKIESLDDVNMALKDIGLAQKELDAIDAKANAEIAKIKEKNLEGRGITQNKNHRISF